MAENSRSRNLIDREAAVDTYVFDSGSTQMPAVLIRALVRLCCGAVKICSGFPSSTT